ncbi:MAG: efflux RND transporter permease subunit [Parachlamydiales bacterium]|nr:efflux RND transporter permease subunit [Parachlamydiales bacterium]
MNLSEPFIRRPVMTTLVMISLFIFGLIAYRNLPISNLPNVDYPTITVSTEYPGAKPEIMANNVTVPLEREFMTIDGLQVITSTSSTGASSIILQFVLNKSIEEASVDVQAAINRAQPNLPKDLPYNPTYQTINPSATPILYYALTSDTLSSSKLYDYGNTYIGQRLSMIEGVSQVLTYGAPYAARIQIDPEKIAGIGLGVDEIAEAIRQGNVDLPTGVLFGEKKEFTIDVDGQLTEALGYKELGIKTQDGAIVKIYQIGRALDSLQDDKYSIQFASKTEKKSAIILAIQRQPGANTLKVIENIKTILPTMQKTLPSSLTFHVIFDMSEYISASVSDVKITLILAFFLVVFVIYIALGKLRDTIIPAIALPLAIFGTFSVMYLFHFSIDILSLLAITLSIGFLVDDAVVVLENNVRLVQSGKKPFEASLEGSKEISITILSMTLCLMTVFIPMLFMGGVIGRLFREFAVTIVAAVFISGFISLTLTPLLCSRFISPDKTQKKKNFSDKLNAYFVGMYHKALEKMLHHRVITLLGGLVCLVGSIALFLVLPTDFLPDDDMSFLKGFSEAQDGTSPFLMGKYQEEINDRLIQDPAVEFILSAAAVSQDNEGVMFTRLKPYQERGPIRKVVKRLMDSTLSIVGVNSYLSLLPLIDLEMGQGAKAPYQYTLTCLDSSLLKKNTQALMQKLQQIPGFTQVSTDLQVSQPQLFCAIDRDRASDLNISAEKIERALSLFYSDNKISTINGEINQYDVIIETLPSYYRNPEVLKKLYIRSDTNDLVPLSEIVSMSQQVGPLTVNHMNGLPSSTISFELNNIPLGTAVSQLEELAQNTLSHSISGSIQGTADVFKESFRNLRFLFMITIFLIYIILGILYESFIHPLTVMSALPPTVLGGLFTLYLFGETLSLYSFVGLILLIGIVMKNGIMMVDFANKIKIEEKKSAYEAIFSACMIRFRPIIMTTAAALMGAIPIAIGMGGASAQGRRPLGMVIVGGLVISQILTLFLTPVIYYYLETLQEWIQAKKEQRKINRSGAKIDAP